MYRNHVVSHNGFLILISLIIGQANCIEQDTFKRYVEFGADNSSLEEHTLTNQDDQFSNCLRLCYEETECLSLHYQNGSCSLFRWYFRFPMDEGLYFGKTINPNAADGKSAISSTPSPESNDCVKDVRGNLNASEQCENGSLANYEIEGTLLTVDLEKIYQIVRVAWMGRKDSLNQTNIEILAGITDGDINSLCGTYQGPPTETNWIYIYCTPLTMGRYIMLRTNSSHIDVGDVSVAAFE